MTATAQILLALDSRRLGAFCREPGRVRSRVVGMQPAYWLNAQRNELAIWEETANSALRVFGEIAEVGQLVEFGEANGITSADSGS